MLLAALKSCLESLPNAHNTLVLIQDVVTKPFEDFLVWLRGASGLEKHRSGAWRLA